MQVNVHFLLAVPQKNKEKRACACVCQKKVLPSTSSPKGVPFESTFIYVGATLPAAPSVRTAKSRQFSTCGTYARMSGIFDKGCALSFSAK